MSERVAVLGASPKKDRYSNKAVSLLIEKGHDVVPIHPVEKEIEGIKCVKSISEIEGEIDTLTVYVNPRLVLKFAEDIKNLSPSRVILNPGTDTEESIAALKKYGLNVVKACTLVLLNTGQF